MSQRDDPVPASRAGEQESATPDPRRHGWGSADVLRVAALVLGFYLVMRLVWFAHLLFLVAFLGILFGLAISQGVDRFQRGGIPRGVGAAGIVIAFFALLVGFGAWLAPTIHDQSIELQHQLPDAINRFESWVNSRQTGLVGLVVRGIASGTESDTTGAGVVRPPMPGAAPTDSVSIESAVRRRFSANMSRITHYFFPFISSTLEVVTGFLIIVFLSIYIAIEPDLYRRGIMHLFPHDHRERAGEVLSGIASVLRKWLLTQLIAMLTIGLVVTIVLLALGVKAAVALGLLAGLFEFIPTVGPIISALPAIAMGFLDSPQKAVWVTVAYILIQFFENHMLIPLLMKGGIDLPPALTVFSQALMALLLGFLGLMCAVPLLAATVVAVRMTYVEGVLGDPHGTAPLVEPDQIDSNGPSPPKSV